MDLATAASLDWEGRLHTRGLSDGLVPGEGAGFLLVGTTRRGWPEQRSPRARWLGSEKPYQEEGLAQAVLGIEKGYRQAPGLVRCSSDRTARGAALLDAAA